MGKGIKKNNDHKEEGVTNGILCMIVAGGTLFIGDLETESIPVVEIYITRLVIFSPRGASSHTGVNSFY